MAAAPSPKARAIEFGTNQTETELNTIGNTAADAAVAANANTKIWGLTWDNSNNASEQEYYKLVDAATYSLPGDVPDLIFPLKGGEYAGVEIIPGLPMTSAISCACVQEAGTAGTTDPTSAVSVSIITDETS